MKLFCVLVVLFAFTQAVHSVALGGTIGSRCSLKNFLQSQVEVEVGVTERPEGRSLVKNHSFIKSPRDERKLGVIVAYDWPVACCVHADLVGPHILAVVVRVCLVYSDFLAIALD